MNHTTLIVLAFLCAAPTLANECDAVRTAAAVAAREGLHTEVFARLEARVCGGQRARTPRRGHKAHGARAPHTGRVEAFRWSDGCAGQRDFVFGPASVCSDLPNSPGVWSIRVDGRCYDIEDGDLRPTCEAFKNGVRGAKFFRSDKCTSKLLAAVPPRQPCEALGDKMRKERVWGVEVGGVCYDILDTTLDKACSQYRYGG